jgi:hypothetical protein
LQNLAMTVADCGKDKTMGRMHTLVSLGTATLCAAFLAGCMGSPGGRPPLGGAQSGFEGEWVGTDGVAVSSLQGGKFSSRSLATGETLTNGTYTMRDPKTIDLDFFSVRTNQNTKATCLLADVNQMNCTLATGTQFILTRKLA